MQRLVPSGLWSSDGGVVRWESLSPTLCPDPQSLREVSSLPLWEPPPLWP